MAMNQIKQYAPFTGVGVGGLATAQVPVGGTHATYLLRFLTGAGALITEAQLINDVDLVRVKVDGETYFEATGEAALRMFEYYYEARMGVGVTAGTLPICLSPDFYDDSMQAAALAWGTAQIGTITIEVQLDGAAITTAQIDLRVEKNNINAGLFRHIRTTRFRQNFAATGEQTINNVNPRNPQVDALAVGIFFDDNTSGISSAILTVEADDILTVTPDINATIQGKALRLPQINAAGNSLFMMDFALSNNLNGYLPLHVPAGNGTERPIDDFRVRPTWITAAPGNFDVYLIAVWGKSPLPAKA